MIVDAALWAILAAMIGMIWVGCVFTTPPAKSSGRRDVGGHRLHHGT